MVHLSDLSWDQEGEEAVKAFGKGDVVKARILDVDVEKERVSLGVKQLSEDPFASAMDSIKKGDTVTCTVSGVTDGGLEVTVSGALSGFIRRADLSRERSEQRPDRFAVGDRVDARVTNIDRKDRKLSLSIKAHEMAEEKQAMADYGSSDSGASLGDILGAALNRARDDAGDDNAGDSEQAAAEVPDDAPAAEEPAEAEPEAAPEPETEPEAPEGEDKAS